MENGKNEPIWIGDNTGSISNCVQIKPENENALEIIDCPLKAKYMCMKPTCPSGFHWYDMKTCVKTMDSPTSKTDAVASCKDLHPYANLLSPKSFYQQHVFENYLKTTSLTSKVFLGAELQDNTNWFWDDGNPIDADSGKTYTIKIQDTYFCRYQKTGIWWSI